MALAAREVAEVLVGEVFDMQQSEVAFCMGLLLSSVIGAEMELIKKARQSNFEDGGGEVRNNFVFLGHVADRSGFEAAKNNLAGLRFEQAENAFGESGLARAVGADNANEVFTINGEAEVFDDSMIAIAKTKLLNFN